jgi:hypothetical protein
MRCGPAAADRKTDVGFWVSEAELKGGSLSRCLLDKGEYFPCYVPGDDSSMLGLLVGFFHCLSESFVCIEIAIDFD